MISANPRLTAADASVGAFFAPSTASTAVDRALAAWGRRCACGRVPATAAASPGRWSSGWARVSPNKTPPPLMLPPFALALSPAFRRRHRRLPLDGVVDKREQPVLVRPPSRDPTFWLLAMVLILICALRSLVAGGAACPPEGAVRARRGASSDLAWVCTLAFVEGRLLLSATTRAPRCARRCGSTGSAPRAPRAPARCGVWSGIALRNAMIPFATSRSHLGSAACSRRLYRDNVRLSRHGR